MIHIAVVHEDDKPVRLFRDDKCIFNAYKWAHRHYCLEDEGIPLHKLPDYLKITYHLVTKEQFASLVE
jgi:hypothetical protein